MPGLDGDRSNGSGVAAVWADILFDDLGAHRLLDVLLDTTHDLIGGMLRFELTDDLLGELVQGLFAGGLVLLVQDGCQTIL